MYVLTMSAVFGELLNFPQENGPEVQLRVFGNHDYARYEEINGYTVIYDETLGLFCYADLPENRLISTGVSIAQKPPQQLVRHLQESSAVRRAVVEEKHLHHSPGAGSREEVIRTFGPNQGLLTGRQLSIGSVRGLTILVNFADISSTTSAADVDEMLNGDDFTRNGNICSVREYFRRVSNGKLDYSNTVVGPFTLSRNRNFYINNLLVEEALNLAVASGLDLSQFDSRNEGIIDALNILYAGQSIYQGELWPHNFFIDLEFDSIRTNLYLLTGLGRNPSELSIGTFCHENGHLLCRFPDMYDYGNRDGDDRDSAGIGRFCLMGSGNHLDSGRSPAPVCAYLRDLAGWCDTVIDLNSPGTYSAEHSNYGTVLKYRTSKPNEYFIIENRTRMGLDRAAPASGCAVYHCDIFGSNEFQQGSADRHYQCALLQADGKLELENNLNTGDSSDLFGEINGVVLNHATIPSSKEWDGRESGLVISDLSESGSTITFRVGQTSPSQTILEEISPNLNIPDNNSGGVTSTINISSSGVVLRIKVNVEITHTYIGDLIATLISPRGDREILHTREGGSTDNLNISLDSERPGELSTLVGQPIMGDWVLAVADRARADIGILRKWSIEIESSSF